jgi:hypothetical protein
MSTKPLATDRQGNAITDPVVMLTVGLRMLGGALELMAGMKQQPTAALAMYIADLAQDLFDASVHLAPPEYKALLQKKAQTALMQQRAATVSFGLIDPDTGQPNGGRVSWTVPFSEAVEKYGVPGE